MGGLIRPGLLGLAPQASGARIRKFVLNDVGLRLRIEALTHWRIPGPALRFDSEQQAADYLWTISTGFGPYTPEQWLALSRPLLKPAPDGQGPGVALRPQYRHAIQVHDCRKAPPLVKRPVANL